MRFRRLRRVKGRGVRARQRMPGRAILDVVRIPKDSRPWSRAVRRFVGSSGLAGLTRLRGNLLVPLVLNDEFGTAA